MVKSRRALAAILFLAGSSVLAQQPAAPPSCAAMDAALPPQYAGWAKPRAATAGTRIAALPGSEVGVAYALALAPADSVAYGASPGKAPPSGSYGGMLAVEVARAGTYAAALGAPAWIDLVKDGKPVASTGHGHGPDCSTLRKIVEFPLERGRYVIQLAGSPAPSMTVMLVRKP